MSLLSFIPLIGKVLDRVIPDPAAKASAQLKLIELQQHGELAELDADVKLALGQMAINQEEAKSTNWFIAGWRPFVGWVCGSGLTYQFILQPLLAWASLNFGWIAPPVLDVSVLITMLGGLLGLSGLRTYEKKTNVARDA